MDFVEAQIFTSIDAGEILAMMPDAAALGAWESDGIVHLFWPSELWRADTEKEIAAVLLQLGDEHASAHIQVRVFPDEDWNARWAESVKPIRIGERVLIRQTWNLAESPTGGIELIIDPKQAFGTGYHATTQLLVEWLEREVRGGERVLDVGTGSGILAMVSLRSGAALALGIDNDPVAIECARENASLNGFGPEIEFREAALENLGPSRFDLIVANLDRKTLMELPRSLKSHLRKDGRLLITGLLIDDEGDISMAFGAAEARIVERREREEWIALKIQFSD